MQEDSRRPADSEEGNNPNKVYSEEEARQRGLKFISPQKPDEICEFCGKKLHYEGFVWMKSVIWSPTPQRCTCPQGVEKWKQYDEEQARKRLEEKQREQYAALQLKITKLLGSSGIKKRFQQRRFDNFVADTPARQRAYNVAKAYADTFDKHRADGTGLYIEGTNGTGKTHLAAAIAMQLITVLHIPVICKTASDLLLDIKAAFDKEGVSEAHVLEIYKTVDLLIIDDLGKEQCTDWSISTLYSIVNDRYEEMRPTIITTNYNSDNLVRTLTPKGYDNLKVIAIISRLREVSQVMTMAWEDYRSTR